MTLQLNLPRDLEASLRERFGAEGELQEHVIHALREWQDFECDDPDVEFGSQGLPVEPIEVTRQKIENAYAAHQAGEVGLDGPEAMERLRVKYGIPKRG